MGTLHRQGENTAHTGAVNITMNSGESGRLERRRKGARGRNPIQLIRQGRQLRGEKIQRNADEEKFQLGDRRFDFGTFLGLLSFGDERADFARMIPIESLHNRRLQRRVVRITDHHPCPCDRLQQHPVQTQCQTQGQHQNEFGGFCQHVTTNNTCPVSMSNPQPLIRTI